MTELPIGALRTQCYIDGLWVDSIGAARLSVYNPSTEAVLADVAAANAEDVDLAVASAKRAFPQWSRTPGAARARLLRDIAERVEAKRGHLRTLQSLNSGKPIIESDVDIDDVIATFRYYADLAEQLDGTPGRDSTGAARQTLPVPSDAHHAMITKEACGVVALIVPWNFPMVTTAWKLAPALAAGCTVVLKPSEITPLPELALADIIAGVGLPRGVFNVLPGTGLDVGAPLAEHIDVAKVSFTGSTAVGQEVMRAAANTLKGVSLEMGGKSSIIVFEDADLDLATDLIAGGGFFNAGQMCSATSRVLVARKLEGPLLTRLMARASEMVVGDPFSPDVQMGPLSSQGQYDRVLAHIENGVASGATLVSGGGRPAGVDKGYFISPTLFTHVPAQSALWREEIFGPVLCLLAFDTEEEAVCVANDSDYGLVATVVTADEVRAQRVARDLQAGVIWINAAQLIFPQGSWGGYKRSSIGRELGPFGLSAFQEIKQILTANKYGMEISKSGGEAIL